MNQEKRQRQRKGRDDRGVFAGQNQKIRRHPARAQAQHDKARDRKAALARRQAPDQQSKPHQHEKRAFGKVDAGQRAQQKVKPRQDQYDAGGNIFFHTKTSLRFPVWIMFIILQTRRNLNKIHNSFQKCLRRSGTPEKMRA